MHKTSFLTKTALCLLSNHISHTSLAQNIFFFHIFFFSNFSLSLGRTKTYSKVDTSTQMCTALVHMKLLRWSRIKEGWWKPAFAKPHFWCQRLQFLYWMFLSDNYILNLHMVATLRTTAVIWKKSICFHLFNITHLKKKKNTQRMKLYDLVTTRATPKNPNFSE